MVPNPLLNSGFYASSGTGIKIATSFAVDFSLKLDRAFASISILVGVGWFTITSTLNRGLICTGILKYLNKKKRGLGYIRNVSKD